MADSGSGVAGAAAQTSIWDVIVNHRAVVNNSSARKIYYQLILFFLFLRSLVHWLYYHGCRYGGSCRCDYRRSSCLLLT